MDTTILIAAVVALVILDLLAIRFGVDSRHLEDDTLHEHLQIYR